MAAAIGIITIGGLLVLSGLKGVGITDLISGAVGGTLNPAGGRKEFTSTSAVSNTESNSTDGPVSGTPKDIIDDVVLPIARASGVPATPGGVAIKNATHGPTVTGNQSDHQGPPRVAWAADLSNGSAPTPQMDKLAAALAKRFDIPWTGSGLVTATSGGYRYQLIYRTMQGGNHFNHVHFGVRKT